MKKISLLCFSLFLFNCASAKIWRLNNAGIPADFTTLQTAHDNPGVLAGDTLHLEPSTLTYGSLTCIKKLIIIGNGYLLSQNLNLQANPISSKVSTIVFDAGSSGTVVMGLEVQSAFTVRTSNITISRNYFNYNSIILERSASAYANILISQNLNVNITYSLTGVAAYSNINLLNNINLSFSVSGLTNHFSGSMINNLISSVNTPIENFVIKNNIATSSTSGQVFNTSTSTIAYNMCQTANGWPSGNNNTVSISNTLVFTLTGSIDAQCTLKPGSPALGTGEFGVDRGAFGGINPYVLSGIPPVPSIYLLSAPTNSNGNQINITISTKTNN